jgi:long-chain acyl-CoA synthetase
VVDSLERLPAAPPTVIFVGAVDGFPAFDDYLRDASPTTPADRASGAVMYYTSGTTGRPKGVRRPLPGAPPEDADIPFLDMLGLFGITTSSDDVHLCTSPLYHTAVLAFAGSALHTGQRVVLMDRFDAASTLELIARHGVTNSHMVPTQFHRLLALPEAARCADVSSLRYVVHGAAPCPPDVKRRMIQWWGPVIYEYYGTTEGGGTFVTSAEWLERPGTVGRAWDGADIRILDDHGDELEPGEIGSVYIYLGSEGFRYHNDDGKTAESRIGDYFTVGDIGLMDADGYLFLKDRSSNLIIAGGVNIYPAEIENALLGHPGIADVGVFGVPDIDLGERVVAVVEPNATAVADDAFIDDVRTFATTQLARFKVPREFVLVTRLPRDPSGKLFKRKVRESYLAGELSSPIGTAGSGTAGPWTPERK